MKYLIWLLILPAYIFIGCNESGSESVNEVDYVTYDAYQYMPVAVGNYWIYDFESTAQRGVTKLEIKNLIKDGAGDPIYGFYEDVYTNSENTQAKIVQYYARKNGAIYVCYAYPDSLNADGSPFIISRNCVIKSPVSKGTGYIENADTIGIADIGDIRIKDKEYKNTVLLIKRNGYRTDSTWFAPNVGIVKKKVNTAEGTYTSRTLSSYQLK